MLSAKKLLENARNRIAKRENWIDGYLARSRGTGEPCPCGNTNCTVESEKATPTDPNAVSWCALGAVAAEAGLNPESTTHCISMIYDHENFEEALRILGKAGISLFFPTSMTHIESARTEEIANFIPSVNDGRGHEATLEMFDHAIASMKGE